MISNFKKTLRLVFVVAFMSIWCQQLQAEEYPRECSDYSDTLENKIDIITQFPPRDGVVWTIRKDGRVEFGIIGIPVDPLAAACQGSAGVAFARCVKKLVDKHGCAKITTCGGEYCADKCKALIPERDSTLGADIDTNRSCAKAKSSSGKLTTNDGDTKYECKNYQCTCTIGSDCKEMFDTIKIVDCKDGAPGELECESKPKDD